jgi:DNA-binding transcriptional regulator YiaG
MTPLPDLRRDAGLSQRDLAVLLSVPVNTLRMWDCGLRQAPMLLQARSAIAHHVRQSEWLPL